MSASSSTGTGRGNQTFAVTEGLSAFASSSRRPIKCLRDMTWGEFKRECGIELGKSKQRSSIRIR